MASLRLRLREEAGGAAMTDDQFKAIVRELRIVQIILAVMIVILLFIAGWLQPRGESAAIQTGLR
jgi:hypothetical protein